MISTNNNQLTKTSTQTSLPPIAPASGKTKVSNGHSVSQTKFDNKSTRISKEILTQTVEITSPSKSAIKATRKLGPRTTQMANKAESLVNKTGSTQIGLTKKTNPLPPIAAQKLNAKQSLEESKGPLLSFGQDLNSFNKTLEKNPFGVAPQRGANGIKELREQVFIKAHEKEEIDLEHANTMLLRELGTSGQLTIQAPQSTILTSEQVQLLLSDSDSFKEIKEKNIMVSGKVRGLTLADILERKDMAAKFNENIESRMTELGQIAAMDMLIGNRDRLIRLQSDSKGGMLLDPLSNMGNIMYKTPDGSVGQVVLIDNSTNESSGYENHEELSSYAQSFVTHMDKQADLADHILLGLTQGFEKNSSLSPRESLVEKFNQGRDVKVSYDQLKKAVMKGISEAKTAMIYSDEVQMQLRSMHNSAFKENKLHVATHIEMVLGKLEGLKIEWNRKLNSNPFRKAG